FLLRTYRPANHTIGLEVINYEADQVSNPYGFNTDPYVDDGIKLDQFGRMIACFILDQHPGSMNSWLGPHYAGQWYPACDVAHLFRKERPGQVRGIPRITPSLELFPKMRRHTLATLAAAEAV